MKKIRNLLKFNLIILFIILFFNIYKVDAKSEIIQYEDIITQMPEILEYSEDDPEKDDLKNILINDSSFIQSQSTWGTQITVQDAIQKYEDENTFIGIDVSKWQGEIDWKKVKDSGIKYVMIRCGYRGYGSNGTLVKDQCFDTYIKGALENDLYVGVYFFSTAINEKEAIQEAQFVLDVCDGYNLTYPIAYDFEYFEEKFDETTGNPYRTNGLTNKQINKNAKAFLGYIKNNSSYKTMLYGSSYYLDSVWNVSEYLNENDIWLANYPSKLSSNKSEYLGEYQMWQFTDAGVVPGINTLVDMNFDYTYYLFHKNKVIFLDVQKDDWYYNPVKYCKDNGIILGYGETREYFMPNDKITRGMFVTILYRMAGKPEFDLRTAKKFPDVKNGEYYEKSVLWASSVGIVSGFEDGTFGPNKPILRQDLVIMFRNYVKKILGKDVSVEDDKYLMNFEDYYKIDEYAFKAVGWAVENQVITGKEKNNKKYVDPLGTATRAETASIIRKYILSSRNVEYDNGFEIKGKILISKIGLEENVLEEATAESLTIAPSILSFEMCSSMRETTVELNIPGTNVVILGRNYPNEEQFSNLEELTIGDNIIIINQDGKVIEYIIYDMYYTEPDDTTHITRELDIDVREITLETTSDDGKEQLIILAKDK